MASHTCLQSFVEINDPVLSVRLLPDVVVTSNVNVKSHIVEKQSNLLHQKYAGKIAEYDIGFKAIDSEINEKLMKHCKDCEEKLCNYSLTIDHHLQDLKNCVTSDYFLHAWDFVTKTVTSMFTKINELGESFILIEKERLKRIKSHMQTYYIDVHDHCYSDKIKLDDFFEEEISDFNTIALTNYQTYTTTISRLKLQLVQKLDLWHGTWELQLFSWRDCVIRENIQHIEKLSRDKKFIVPEELETTRASCMSSLDHAESSIDDILENLAKAMPVSVEVAVQTFDKVGNIFTYYQNAILKYNDQITRIFDKQFCKLTEHIGNMRGYLISNSVFEENNSLELFEYSIYAICEEFENHIIAMQKKYMEEMDKKLKSKESICEEIKEYTFCGCNAWGLYLQGYERACNKYIGSFEHGLKRHNSNISSLEKSFNKSCCSLSESKSMKMLDKRFDEVAERLNKIFAEYERYQSTLNDNVEFNVEEWLQIEKNQAQDLLRALNLKIVPVLTVPDILGSFVFEGDTYVFSDSRCPNSFQYKLSCSKYIVNKVSLQRESNLQDLREKLTKQMKQADHEVEMRKGLHQPRLSVVKKEVYDMRVKDIAGFNRDCEIFWDQISQGELECSGLFKDLSFDTDAVINNYKNDVVELKKLMNKQETSEELTLVQPLIKKKAISRRAELIALVDSFQSKIEDCQDKIRGKEKFLVSISDKKSLKMMNDVTIRNECDEFAELAEDLKDKADLEKQKVAHIQETENNNLAHYKHTIFCLFFLEKKKEILKNCRMQIKSASVSCNKEVMKFEKDKKEFTTHTICPSFENNKKLIEKFNALYSLCKRIINMVNYSSGIGESLQQCVSMEKLQRRYLKFGDGHSRLMDSAFLKEIGNASCAKNSIEHVESRVAAAVLTKDDISWKIPRVKIFREYIGRSLAMFKYGVGVKADMANISEHRGSILGKKATLKSYGLDSRPENYWASYLLGKKSKCKSKEEHDSIVKKACAKLRDRRNSQDNSKHIQQNLPQLNRKKVNLWKEKSRPTTSPALPPIPQGLPLTEQDGNSTESIVRNRSLEQVDMDGAVRLTRTVEFLMGTRKRPDSSSSAASYGSEKGKACFYDFLTTPDDTLKTMLFQPSVFFGFKKRCLEADAAASQIVSISEKTKFYLRYAFEQFALSSEVFYRQKNISITKPCIPKDIDVACKDMENDLQLYLNKVGKFCVDIIKKIKYLAQELISYQDHFITELFTSAINHLDSSNEEFIISLQSKFHCEKSELRDEQKRLFSQLKPQMSHPNYHGELAKLLKSANLLHSRGVEKFENLHSDSISFIQNLYSECMNMIENYKDSMYSLADVAIHPSKVKKITRGKFRGVEHKDCLKDYMPGESPRKLHQLFIETDQDLEGEICKVQTKFYDHIQAENARAVVHVNTWYEETKEYVNEIFSKEQLALGKWLRYLERNINELIGDY